MLKKIKDKMDSKFPTDEEINQIIKKLSNYVLSDDKNRLKIFDLGQENGIHITPVHFYDPIPDTRTLNDEIFNKSPHFPELKINEENQISILKRLGKYSHELKNIPQKSTKPNEFFYENGQFPNFDAVIYYSMIREFKPKTIVEVGSGFSTLIASLAAQKNEDTKINCVEPYPRDFLKKGLPNLDELVVKKVQDVPITKFQEIRKNDILFIDSTHISTIGSDVNYLILHVIPELKPGTIIHVHDCPLPYEMSRYRIMERKRFWNEMYLIWAFLMGNVKYEIMLLNYFLIKKYPSLIKEIFPMTQEKLSGASLWFQKLD